VLKTYCWHLDQECKDEGYLSYLLTLSAAVTAAMGRSPYEWTERLMPLVKRALKERQLEARKEASNLDGHSTGKE